MSTMILPCKCENAGQDKLHGNKRRVFNKTSKETNLKPVWRCTVCANEKTAGEQNG